MEDQQLDNTSKFEKWWNDPEFVAAREEFQKNWKKAMDKLEEGLTPEMVSDIRQWRCDEDYSWRSVATTFYEKYQSFCEEQMLDDGNQITGMMLCEAAQKLLKQETSEGWN